MVLSPRTSTTATVDVNGLECQNAIDNRPITMWHPASSWQHQRFNKDGKYAYSDHVTNELKDYEEEIHYTLTLDKVIGLSAITLHQHSMGQGFVDKIR